MKLLKRLRLILTKPTLRPALPTAPRPVAERREAFKSMAGNSGADKIKPRTLNCDEIVAFVGGRKIYAPSKSRVKFLDRLNSPLLAMARNFSDANFVSQPEISDDDCWLLILVFITPLEELRQIEADNKLRAEVIELRSVISPDSYGLIMHRIGFLLRVALCQQE